MANEIIINGNVIGGRQGWAYICNSMRFSVLKVDLDREQEYEDYKTFDYVRIVTEYRGKEIPHDGQLEISEGKWQIGGWGCGIHSQFGFGDMYNLINEANRQVLRQDSIIALATFSKDHKVATLSLYKLGKIDPFCQVISRLIPLSDEEMEQIKTDADRWCR